MLTLNPAEIKTPQELRRLAAFAGMNIKDLSKITGLGESAIKNYLSDEVSRVNYLFQFALEYLVEQKKSTIESLQIKDISATYRRNGWVFSYDESTRFIGAEHESGGKQSICEMKSHCDNNHFGDLIVTFLNMKGLIAVRTNNPEKLIK